MRDTKPLRGNRVGRPTVFSRRSVLLLGAAVVSVGGTARAMSDGRGDPFPSVRYLSRAEWGADESLGSSTSTYWPVQTFTVHHTAGPIEEEDSAARVRSIQRDHVQQRGFDDIGYHLLIDRYGTVYEGRRSQHGFRPDADLPNGAHVKGYNAGNLGIALLGSFENTTPTDASIGALTAVLSRLVPTVARRMGVAASAEAVVRYTNPLDGVTATVPLICGHRDWAGASTACPGQGAVAALADVRARVLAPGT